MAGWLVGVSQVVSVVSHRVAHRQLVYRDAVDRVYTYLSRYVWYCTLDEATASHSVCRTTEHGRALRKASIVGQHARERERERKTSCDTKRNETDSSIFKWILVVFKRQLQCDPFLLHEP